MADNLIDQIGRFPSPVLTISLGPLFRLLEHFLIIMAAIKTKIVKVTRSNFEIAKAKTIHALKHVIGPTVIRALMNIIKETKTHVLLTAPC